MRGTTLHGFVYLVEEKSVVVRLIWLVLIVVAFILVGLLFGLSVQEAKDSPFVSTLDSVPIEEVPFPAVTIAPQYINPRTGFLSRFVEYGYDCNQFRISTFRLFSGFSMALN